MLDELPPEAYRHPPALTGREAVIDELRERAAGLEMRLSGVRLAITLGAADDEEDAAEAARVLELALDRAREQLARLEAGGKHAGTFRGRRQ